MSVRHTAGAVFKAFAAHVTVFFVRMADFALTVLRVTRNVVAVMMFMSAAAAFAMTMFVVVLRPAATFIMFTPFMSMSFAAATAIIMAVLVFRLIVVLMPALGTVFMVMVTTAAGPIFMVVMRAHFITAISYIR